MFDRQNYVAQIYIADDINNDQAKEISDSLDRLGRQFVNVPDARILFDINSNGGGIYDANSILSAIRTCQVPVDTFVSGAAFSAAFLLATAGKRRYCSSMANYMFHGMSVEVSMNTMNRVQSDIKHSEDLQNHYVSFIQKNTKISKKRLWEMVKRGEDFYFTPSESKKLGVVDEIVEL